MDGHAPFGLQHCLLELQVLEGMLLESDRAST
jgi:hypothetical protein